jgi:hypothetical protein
VTGSRTESNGALAQATISRLPELTKRPQFFYKSWHARPDHSREIRGKVRTEADDRSRFDRYIYQGLFV